MKHEHYFYVECLFNLIIIKDKLLLCLSQGALSVNMKY